MTFVGTTLAVEWLNATHQRALFDTGANTEVYHCGRVLFVTAAEPGLVSHLCLCYVQVEMFPALRGVINAILRCFESAVW